MLPLSLTRVIQQALLLLEHLYVNQHTRLLMNWTTSNHLHGYSIIAVIREQLRLAL